MKTIRYYLKKYRKESIIGPLFKMLEASFELLVPLVMAGMIDIGIVRQDLPYIWKTGGVLVGLGILGFVCSLTAQFFAAKAAVGVGTKLRHDMFEHIGNLSYSDLDQVGTTTLITRMTSDINHVQAGVNLFLRLFLRSPFIVVGALIMSFGISRRISLIFVATTILLALIIYGIMAITIPLQKKVQGSLDKVLQGTRENLKGVRVIRALCMQPKEKTLFEEDSEKLFSLQMLSGRLSALLNPLTYVVVNVATIGIVWFGGKETFAGDLTRGEVIALVNYMSQILLALVALFNLIVASTKAYACAGRVEQILEMRSDLIEGKKEPEPFGKESLAVVFEDVSFAYGFVKETALKGLNFSVEKGQIVGVIGGTGSGKTTMANLIPRFYDVSSGRVTVFGENVKDYSLKALRKIVGIVPQTTNLFSGSLRENMQMGDEHITDEMIWNALQIAQAKEFVVEKNAGLDFRVAQAGKNLSGGQRQRLCIARALARNPEILILDDSTSALDYATDARFRKALKESVGKMTTFVVSQRVASVMNADKIIVLDDGVMVGIGTHEELKKTCSIYQEFCHSQLKEEVTMYEK